MGAINKKRGSSITEGTSPHIFQESRYHLNILEARKIPSIVQNFVSWCKIKSWNSCIWYYSGTPNVLLHYLYL